MSDTGKPHSLWLFVKEDRSHGYFHLRATVTTDSRERNPNDRTYGERFPYGLDDRYGITKPLYSDLQASCQGDTGSQKSPNRDTAVYGFGRLEYHDTHTIDLTTAERMVRTMKALDRKLAKLSEVRGYARTYPEYVGRLAEVLGAKGIVLERRKDNAEVTGERYEWLSVGDGINQIGNRIYRWQREVLGEEVSA